MQKLISFFEKITWSYVVLAILGGAAFFYFTLDTSDFDTKTEGLQNAAQAIATLEKKVQEAKQFEIEYEAKKKHYAELVRKLQESQGALPKQFSTPDLLSDLLKEAKRLEIEISSILPDPKEEQGDLYNSLAITLDAHGTYLQFFIFLDRLANMKRLVHVVSLDFVKDQDRPLVPFGGEEGAFSSTKLSGGKEAFPGIHGRFKIVTYRYRGGAGPNGGG